MSENFQQICMEEINRLSSSIKTHRENEDSKNFDEIESILTKAPEILFSEDRKSVV